jgi:hypothetical protein
MCITCGKTFIVLKKGPLDYFLLREGCPSANVCVPLISARVPVTLSTAEPLRCVSAGFSPIDTMGAREKYGRARARVHTAYTTFPQAAKSPTKSRSFSQLHAFAQEKSIDPSSHRHAAAKSREIFAAHSVEKAPSCKIYFR